MYRWQDPAPAAVHCIKTRRQERIRRIGWMQAGADVSQQVPVNDHQMPPESPVPSVTIDGVEYVEAPESNGCRGCVFTWGNCQKEVSDKQLCDAFGAPCYDRKVIYIRKA